MMHQALCYPRYASFKFFHCAPPHHQGGFEFDTFWNANGPLPLVSFAFFLMYEFTLVGCRALDAVSQYCFILLSLFRFLTYFHFLTFCAASSLRFLNWLHITELHAECRSLCCMQMIQLLAMQPQVEKAA